MNKEEIKEIKEMKKYKEFYEESDEFYKENIDKIRQKKLSDITYQENLILSMDVMIKNLKSYGICNDIGTLEKNIKFLIENNIPKLE